jgi:hypothetical protein
MRKTDTFDDSPYIFGRNHVSASLFPLFQSGFVLNYDRKMVNRHWFRFTPMFYRKEDYSMSASEDLRSLLGYGFKFQHRYFPYTNTVSQVGLFLSYGPSFQRFSLETKEPMKVDFDKYGFEWLIGFRRVVASVFVVEFYGGLATSYMVNKSDPSVTDWRDVLKNHGQMWFDYGVTGNYFVFGINLGILF